MELVNLNTLNNFEVVLYMSNQIWGWRNNYNGELHDSTFRTNTNIPKDSSGFLTNVIAISAGNRHSLALKADGTVWAWGSNSNGQLGEDTFGINKNIPIQVRDSTDPTGFLTNVIAICASWRHSLALKIDGTVWAWGNNYDGQLGDGTSGINKNTPVQVKDTTDPTGFLSNVIAISAGWFHSLAIKADGTVWTWGNNSKGQLGDGTSGINKKIPVQVKDSNNPTGFFNNAIAIFASWSHSLALKADGTVWAWGNNYDGQLGDGTSGINKNIPVQVKDSTGFISNIRAISAGWFHSLALKTDGRVWAWGGNSSGQLGDGIFGTNKKIPVQVKDTTNCTGFLNNVISISAGWSHSIALKTDGTVWAWSRNIEGQLGDGTSGTNKNIPVQVKHSTNSLDFLTNVIAISAGWSHSLALKTDGTVWAWGNNCNGQLGDGTSGTNKNIAVQVKDITDSFNFITNVMDISAGDRYFRH
ncbi:RCC1-like domain-containing protein [Tepidibacter sp. Z1-5]|uniref:RCC1-like domain-containing protein n=1 Tax=Tepidibacter sp. Z1-5 TaxID=3134138 RepID=UPI0030C466C1